MLQRKLIIMHGFLHSFRIVLRPSFFSTISIVPLLIQAPHNRNAFSSFPLYCNRLQFPIVFFLIFFQKNIFMKSPTLLYSLLCMLCVEGIYEKCSFSYVERNRSLPVLFSLANQKKKRTMSVSLRF